MNTAGVECSHDFEYAGNPYPHNDVNLYTCQICGFSYIKIPGPISYKNQYGRFVWKGKATFNPAILYERKEL